MQVESCRYCKKLFYYVQGDKLCTRCRDVLEERFRMVKEYIYENPGATAHVVAHEFDISVETIYRWVREERLEFSGESLFGLPCEYCGEKIKVGRFCNTCKNTLGNKLSQLYQEEKEPAKNEPKQKGPKMRFIQE